MYRLSMLLGVLAPLLLTACGRRESGEPEPKAPRPVTVFRLLTSDPSRLQRVTGSIASWKTEAIGFEVPGRVTFVEEPDTEVQGRVFNAEDQIIMQGALLASIDAQRYKLQVASVKALINTTTEKKKAAEIELAKVIPARERAAQAEVRVTQATLKRTTELVKTGAVTQSQYDRDLASSEQAQAQLAQVVATRETQSAEVAALQAEIEQYQQQLAEAEQDLADCRLEAPFNGQIAQVHAIPGAYVERGEPVITLQMMDPIAVEVELSAAKARLLDYRDILEVFVTRPDGTNKRIRATLYMTDPVADPKTRTFTATLLARNHQVPTPIPEEMQQGPIIRTSDLWKVLTRPFAGRDVAFVENSALHQDADGHYVWKVTNRTIGTLANQANPKLDVVKVRVIPGQRSVSLLGLWRFREIQIAEGEAFDVEVDLVTGELVFPAGADAATFTGGAILFDRKQWLLRSGDLVAVNLSGASLQPGFYVPLDAILEQSGRKFIFLAESSQQGAVARKIEVRTPESAGTLRRVEAVGDVGLEEGMEVIAGGALLLNDGEAVNVAGYTEPRR